jgi:hypothetical protein
MLSTYLPVTGSIRIIETSPRKYCKTDDGPVSTIKN